MKNVLLTTTALVAFAGVASAAEVAMDWSGYAELGYNMTVSTDTVTPAPAEYLAATGFYSIATADLDVTIGQDLGNGATATLVIGDLLAFDLATTPRVTIDPTLVATLATSYGSISFGDIENVNLGVFAEIGGMVMTTTALAAVDAFGIGHTVSGNQTAADGTGVRAETNLGGFALAVSTDDGTDVALNVSGSVADVNFAAYYETSMMGITASTSVSGLDLAFAYADDTVDTSTGVSAGYALTDAFSVSGSFVSNTSVSQINVGAAYAAGGLIATADYDVTASDMDLAAGYTTEIQAGMTVSLGVTASNVLTTAVVGYSADVAYVAGDLGVYAGYNNDGTVGNTYAGVNYDLGNGANAFAYTATATDAGPMGWFDGARAGVSLTF